MFRSLQRPPKGSGSNGLIKGLIAWPSCGIILLLISALFLHPGILTVANLSLVLIGTVSSIAQNKNLNVNLLRVTLPFVVIVLIGLAMGAGAEYYSYLKDAWYILNPAFIIGAGYVLYTKAPDFSSGLRAFVIAGTLISAFFLSAFVLHPGLILKSAVAIRETVGTGYYGSALALTILMVHFKKWENELRMPNWLAVGCMVVCTIAVILTFSRTMTIVTFIGICGALGVFNRNSWRSLIMVTVASFLFLALLNFTVDISYKQAQQTFIGKLARSLSEIRIQEYYDFRKINENWRGYETARALRQYYAGTPTQWLLGQGLGAKVDLGFPMALGGEYRVRFIPVLHNGYAYLLIKGGAVAALLFLSAIFSLYVTAIRVSVTATKGLLATASHSLQSIAIALAVSTWLVAGVFNKLDMFPYLLAAGFLLAAIASSGRT